MRPLFFDFDEDKTCYNIDDQFLFGPDILVAPVLYQDKKNRKVYLPKNCSWLNLWEEQEEKGGQWIKANAPLKCVPFYIKKGTNEHMVEKLNNIISENKDI